MYVNAKAQRRKGSECVRKMALTHGLVLVHVVVVFFIIFIVLLLIVVSHVQFALLRVAHLDHARCLPLPQLLGPLRFPVGTTELLVLIFILDVGVVSSEAHSPIVGRVVFLSELLRLLARSVGLAVGSQQLLLGGTHFDLSSGPAREELGLPFCCPFARVEMNFVIGFFVLDPAVELDAADGLRHLRQVILLVLVWVAKLRWCLAVASVDEGLLLGRGELQLTSGFSGEEFGVSGCFPVSLVEGIIVIVVDVRVVSAEIDVSMCLGADGGLLAYVHMVLVSFILYVFAQGYRTGLFPLQEFLLPLDPPACVIESFVGISFLYHLAAELDPSTLPHRTRQRRLAVAARRHHGVGEHRRVLHQAGFVLLVDDDAVEITQGRRRPGVGCVEIADRRADLGRGAL
mmetsp:Transcript_48494/g.121382  ORF Transcript_48494/g.121382 Transcript_48494/m.121382 type:complete len:401 (+) Transcript_48494:79-1281(+)